MIFIWVEVFISSDLIEELLLSDHDVVCVMINVHVYQLNDLMSGRIALRKERPFFDCAALFVM